MALVIISTSEKNAYFNKDRIGKILGQFFSLCFFNFERKCRHRRDRESEATAGRENTLKDELKYQQN